MSQSTPSSLDPDPTPVSAPGGSPLLRWSSLSDGLIVGFLVSGTTLFAALILRAQHEGAWKALLVAAAVGFVVAGGVAGRHRRTRKGALAQGCAVGLLLATAVITATALRYLVLGASVSASMGQVWIAAAVTAVIAAAAGGLLGRRAYLRSRRRKAKTT